MGVDRTGRRHKVRCIPCRTGMASHPITEPILGFAPGSAERTQLQAEMDRQMSEVVEIPCVINGEEVFTGNTTTQVIPHDHGTFWLTSTWQGRPRWRRRAKLQ